MVAKNVQVSLDDQLVQRIDSRPETQKLGRSAIVRRALELYLERVTSAEIDDAYRRGYGGATDEVDREFAPFLAIQALPDDDDEVAAPPRVKPAKRKKRAKTP